LSVPISSFDLAALAANMAEDKKAKDTLVLMTEQVSTLADYFVVASVESRPQMMALADFIVKTLKSRNLHPIGQEVDKGGRWSLLDYGEVVIHLFNQEDRSFYNLERFWNHATEVPRSRWSQEEKQAS
jgi:ribosome-associated protein